MLNVIKNIFVGCKCRSSWSCISSENVGHAQTNRKV